MNRIEQIGDELKFLSAKSFPPVIQPDGNECQQRKGLRGKFVRAAEQGDCLAFEEEDIQNQQSSQLPELCKAAFMKEIEDDHGSNALPTVIHKTQYT